MKKLAVFFPGVGYHCDKPLLYFSRKLAEQKHYEIRTVPYGGFERGIKGDKEKMEKAFYHALSQAKTMLEDIDFSSYDRILFISKSVGTIVAGAYAKEKGLEADHIFYTPLEETFNFGDVKGIAFHGSGDSWADTKALKKKCERKNVPLYIIEGGDHSLETGHMLHDMKELEKVMEISKKYM